MILIVSFQDFFTEWNYQTIVGRAAPGKLRRLLVCDSAITLDPAHLPQGQMGSLSAHPLTHLLGSQRISAPEESAKSKSTNLNKATQSRVWKPVLPLVIYAIFSSLLNFSEAQL